MRLLRSDLKLGDLVAVDYDGQTSYGTLGELELRDETDVTQGRHPYAIVLVVNTGSDLIRVRSADIRPLNILERLSRIE